MKNNKRIFNLNDINTFISVCTELCRSVDLRVCLSYDLGRLFLKEYTCKVRMPQLMQALDEKR